MDKKKTFTALIQETEGGGAFVVVPFDVEKTFGKKRVKMLATFDGEPYRGSLVRMGRPEHMLLIRKDIRGKIGKSIGDTVAVTLAEDTKPRTIEVPVDFKQALKKAPEADSFFQKLSYTHKKEYVNWITEAKKEETRIRRIVKAVEMLRSRRRER